MLVLPMDFYQDPLFAEAKMPKKEFKELIKHLGRTVLVRGVLWDITSTDIGKNSCMVSLETSKTYKRLR
jgi:hypothetical protein